MQRFLKELMARYKISVECPDCGTECGVISMGIEGSDRPIELICSECYFTQDHLLPGAAKLDGTRILFNPLGGKIDDFGFKVKFPANLRPKVAVLMGEYMSKDITDEDILKCLLDQAARKTTQYVPEDYPDIKLVETSTTWDLNITYREYRFTPINWIVGKTYDIKVFEFTSVSLNVLSLQPMFDIASTLADTEYQYKTADVDDFDLK